MTAYPKTIILSGDPEYDERPLEAPDVYGVGDITPGMLIELNSSGNVQPHSTSGGNALPMFAVEDGLFEGRGVDDDYTVDGEVVRFAHCSPGDKVYAWLAAGQDVAIADLLQSNGDGYLITYSDTTPPPLRIVAEAQEAVDNAPGTDSLPVRIRVKVV